MDRCQTPLPPPLTETHKKDHCALSYTECLYCDWGVSHVAVMCAQGLSSGVVCWPGRRQYTVTCSNRLVPSDTVIVTHILGGACAMRVQGSTSEMWDARLCLTLTSLSNPPTIDSGPARLKMLRWFRHQSQRCTSPNQCVYNNRTKAPSTRVSFRYFLLGVL